MSKKIKLALILISAIITTALLAWYVRERRFQQKGYARERNSINWDKIKKSAPLLKHTFLVFRQGADGISDMFCKMNQTDQSYSHCGIVLKDTDGLWIYHSIGGEDNPRQKIKRESFSTFVHPKNNFSYGIFTFNFSKDEQVAIDSIIHHWYNQGRTFDNDFQLDNDSTQMYCVELIYKAILLTKKDNQYINTSRLKDFEYVAPDNIWKHKDAVPIERVMYE